LRSNPVINLLAIKLSETFKLAKKSLNRQLSGPF